MKNKGSLPSWQNGRLKYYLYVSEMVAAVKVNTTGSQGCNLGPNYLFYVTKSFLSITVYNHYETLT